MMSSGVGFATAQATPTITSNNNNIMLDNQIYTKVQQNPDIVFFNKQDFQKGNSFNVTRNLLVNQWGYTVINDTIQMYVNDSQFNAFNYSIPMSVYPNVNHIELDMRNGNVTTHAINKIYTKANDNKTEDITFVFNKTATLVNQTFNIITGIQNLVSIDKSNGVFPLKFAGVNFFPLFDFPMTNYDFHGGVIAYSSSGSSAVNKGVDNSTYLPDPNTLGISASIASDLTANRVGFDYSKMNTLANFNYSAISSEYQHTGTLKFIPGYQSRFLSNFTFPVVFNYMVTNSLLEYSLSKVTITISQWGTITYHEVTTIVNLGLASQSISGIQSDSSIPIYVNAPKVKSFVVDDNYGNLSNSAMESFNTPDIGFPVNSTLIHIQPRSAILPGQSYTFDLQYSIPASTFMKDVGSILTPKYELNLPAMSLFNWTNKRVDLAIVFPALSSISMPKTLWGMTVSGSNINNNNKFGFLRPAIVLTLNNFSELDNIFEKITFTVPPVIGPFFQVFENAMILFIIGLLVIFTRLFIQKYSHYIETTGVAEQQIPFDLMRDFVTAYEEKTALRSRLSELEKKKKNLRKVEYEQLVQTLKNKQKTNDKKLISVTAQLVKVNSSYRESIRTLELAEAERDQILAQIADLDQKKKQSRIRPEIYNKLKNEQNSRLNKAISRIERVLNELRSLLREAK